MAEVLSSTYETYFFDWSLGVRPRRGAHQALRVALDAVKTGTGCSAIPTQKPVALLERILNASSKLGQSVLDPFCGCGTTIEAA
jgi:DNA modification methylase